MKFYAIIFSLLISCLSPLGYAQTLTDKIDALIEQQLPHATVGVLIKDAQTGQVIYQKNEDKLLSPASGMKLFTATAALYQLKPDYYFVTTLSQKGDNVYITFTGSPSLTIENLNDLLANLKKNGVTRIQGNIVLDVSRFQLPNYPNGTSYDDLGWYYSAPDSATILNENAVEYDFISAKKIGMPIQIKPKTSPQGITLINEVVTVDAEQAKDHCTLNIDIQPHNTLRLFGCLAQNAEPQPMQLAVPEPILLVKQTIQDFLNKNGLILQGKIVLGRTPADAHVIARMPSENLSVLIIHMLRESDNLYANSLTKLLGYTVTGEGTYKQGTFAMRQILSQHTAIDFTQTEIADGVGTRYNLTTPEQMVILLTNLYQDKQWRPIFFNALPQAGVSGTLEDRMKKTPLEKRVWAKTGTMHDISSLSGYLMHSEHQHLIFSIIINGINTPIEVAKSLEEKILLIIEDNYWREEEGALKSATNNVKTKQ